MLCTKCKGDNPGDAQFCQGCGARLELICPTCATANGLDANFCKKCGTRLAAATEVPSETAKRVFEFFTTQISNDHTRQAYDAPLSTYLRLPKGFGNLTTLVENEVQVAPLVSVGLFKRVGIIVDLF